MSDLKHNAATCPLCGNDNQCAIVAGLPPEGCWCQSTTISTEARLKVQDAANTRCLCPACGKPNTEVSNAR